jgi:hypothetical protein
MKPNGSIDWINAGLKIGINLENQLYQDKNAMYKKLDELNLPRPKTLIYKNNEYKNELEKIKEFIEEGKIIYCRVQPLKYNLPKFSKKDIKTIDDFILFINEKDFSFDNYELHLVQNGVMEYSGIIISSEKIVGELVRGHCDKIQFGTDVTPLNVQWNDILNKFLFYNNDGYSENEKKILLNTMNMLKIPKNPIKGYFEFYITDNKLIFKNYQTGEISNLTE